jgi:hypothetical protein
MTDSSIPIMILNWNGAGVKVSRLDSLASLTYSSFNVKVVYDGLTEDSLVRL